MTVTPFITKVEIDSDRFRYEIVISEIDSELTNKIYIEKKQKHTMII